jgi:hypothetical protein
VIDNILCVVSAIASNEAALCSNVTNYQPELWEGSLVCGSVTFSLKYSRSFKIERCISFLKIPFPSTKLNHVCSKQMEISDHINSPPPLES